MKTHNRALDYVLLAMKELRSNKPVAAANMLTKAVGSGDALRAMQILEASNRVGFQNDQKRKVRAGRRVRANDDLADPLGSMDDEEMSADTMEDEEMDLDADEMGDDEMDLDADEIDDADEMGDEVAAGRRMARVLSGMKRNRGRRR